MCDLREVNTIINTWHTVYFI